MSSAPTPQEVQDVMLGLLRMLRAQQEPGRRDPRDRYLAIVITEQEKVLALYTTFVQNNLRWEGHYDS